MNADQVEIFGTLRGRIKEVIKQLDKEKEESNKLKKELEELRNRFELQNKDYKDLEHKYNNLKLAKVLSTDNEEGNEARLRVNRMVREIDKCIALLNR